MADLHEQAIGGFFNTETTTDFANSVALATQYAKLVEEVPSMAHVAEDVRNRLGLELKRRVVEDENLSGLQKAAALQAINEAGSETSAEAIGQRANELAELFEAAHQALSKPGTLMMEFGDMLDDTRAEPFKTSGSGLRVGIYDRDSGYEFMLYAGAEAVNGEEYDVSIRPKAAEVIVTEPDIAMELGGFPNIDERRIRRLIVGQEPVAAFLAEAHTFPIHTYQRLRELGFRLEKVNPKIKEQFEIQAESRTLALVNSILTNSQFNRGKYELERQRSQLADIEFLGGSRREVKQEVLGRLMGIKAETLGWYEQVITKPEETLATETS